MAFQEQEQDTNKAIVYAMRQVQKRNLRLDQERTEARKMLDEMNAEVARERAETQRRRDDSAPWKGAISGAMSGMGLGAPFGGVGMAVGGVLGGIAGGVMGAQDPDLMYETAPYAAQLGGMGLQVKGQMDQSDAMQKRLDAWEALSRRAPPGYSEGPSADLTAGTMGQALTQDAPETEIAAPQTYDHGNKYSSLSPAGQKVMSNFKDMPAYDKWVAEQPGGGAGITNWAKAQAAWDKSRR